MTHTNSAPGSGEASAVLTRSLSDFCRLFNQGGITPFLEADVASILYHFMLLNGCAPAFLFSQARIKGLPRLGRKYDLVVGTPDLSEGTVSPSLIVQIKCFQRWGHTNQQFHIRFGHILEDDIPSLSDAAPLLDMGRIELIADLTDRIHGTGYLEGLHHELPRKMVLGERCRTEGIQLFWVHPQSGGNLAFETLK